MNTGDGDPKTRCGSYQSAYLKLYWRVMTIALAFEGRSLTIAQSNPTHNGGYHRWEI